VPSTRWTLGLLAVFVVQQTPPMHLTVCWHCRPGYTYDAEMGWGCLKSLLSSRSAPLSGLSGGGHSFLNIAPAFPLAQGPAAIRERATPEGRRRCQSALNNLPASRIANLAPDAGSADLPNTIAAGKQWACQVRISVRIFFRSRPIRKVRETRAPADQLPGCRCNTRVIAVV